MIDSAISTRYCIDCRYYLDGECTHAKNPVTKIDDVSGQPIRQFKAREMRHYGSRIMTIGEPAVKCVQGRCAQGKLFESKI